MTVTATIYNKLFSFFCFTNRSIEVQGSKKTAWTYDHFHISYDPKIQSHYKLVLYEGYIQGQ